MTDAPALTTPTLQPSPDALSPSPSPSPAPGDASLTTTTRPEYIPDTFWDPTTNTVKAQEFSTHYSDLAAVKAANDARIAALPKDAAGYAIAPPKDFKVPDGWAIDEKHPLAAPVRAIAHKHQLSQEAVSDLVQAQGEAQMAEDKAQNDKRAAETAKMGPNVTARVTAIKTFLGGLLSPQAATDLLGDDNNYGLVVYSAKALDYFEELQRKFSSQGGANYSSGGRETPASPPQTIKDRWYRKAS